jgi:hypothetical protein
MHDDLQLRYKRIRMRAREIWEREGRPLSAHERHWTEAIREIDAEDAAGIKYVPTELPDKAIEQIAEAGLAGDPKKNVKAARLLRRPLGGRRMTFETDL